MGVHRNIDANFLRGVMPKVPSKKHPYENFGMPYVFLWILHDDQRNLSEEGKNFLASSCFVAIRAFRS